MAATVVVPVKYHGLTLAALRERADDYDDEAMTAYDTLRPLVAPVLPLDYYGGPYPPEVGAITVRDLLHATGHLDTAPSTTSTPTTKSGAFDKYAWLRAIDNDPRIGHRAWAVAQAVGGYLFPRDRMWASQTRLGATARMHRNRVGDGLAELVEAGYLVPDGKVGRSTAYVAVVPS